MKSIYSKQLLPVLQGMMAVRHPEFDVMTVRLSKDQRRRSTMVPGEKIFVQRTRNDLWIFISFVPNQSQERFMIDIGWSRNQQFPWDITRLGSGQPLDEPEKFDECMVDFVHFLSKATGHGVFFGWDVWSCSVPPEHPDFKKIFVQEYLMSVSDDDARVRVEVAVSGSLDDLDKYVFPWIDEKLRPIAQ